MSGKSNFNSYDNDNRKYTSKVKQNVWKRSYSTHDFYDWLVQMGYCDVEDEIEDLEDVVRDFQCIQQTAPKLFNLLRSISQ